MKYKVCWKKDAWGVQEQKVTEEEGVTRDLNSCSVLQCDAVCWSVLQRDAVWCSCLNSKGTCTVAFFQTVTWLNHMCDMTNTKGTPGVVHLNVYHAWLICVTWLMQKRNAQLHVFIAYGVATGIRLLKIIGLFCKRALWKRRYSAKETCNFKEPTNRSHPILCLIHMLDITHTKGTCAVVLFRIVTIIHKLYTYKGLHELLIDTNGSTN